MFTHNKISKQVSSCTEQTTDISRRTREQVEIKLSPMIHWRELKPTFVVAGVEKTIGWYALKLSR